MEDTEFRVRSQYERSLGPGETVFEQGEAGDKLYVIQAGEVELTREGPSGHRVVARLGPGDFFGELCMVAGQRHSTRAVAVNTTRVLELDRETLEGMCMAQPQIAIRMIRVLAARLIEAERRLAALGVDDLLQPVVQSLLRRAQPGEGEIRIDTSLRAIAEETGLSMLEAHRALHQLFDRKVLRLVDEQLIARDLDSLSACLEQ
jgi:CRP-like cAMP-binding protein